MPAHFLVVEHSSNLIPTGTGRLDGQGQKNMARRTGMARRAQWAARKR